MSAGADQSGADTQQSAPGRARLWFRPNIRIAALGLASITLMLIVVVTLAITRYRVELADAARELRTLDLLLAKESGRSLQSVSLVLDSVAEQMLADKPTRPDEFAAFAATAETHAMLQGRVAGLPQLDGLSLVGLDGKLLNFSRAWPVPDIRLDDRAYFKHLVTEPDAGTYLTAPVLSRTTGSPTVYVARRLIAHDGTLLGFVVGAIEVDYFEQLYKSLHLDPGDAVALWRQDGALIARFPAALPGGEHPADEPQAPENHRPDVQSASERQWSLDESGPITRVVATQPVAGFPLVMVVGRSKTSILADWRQEMLAISGFVVVAVLCLIAMFWAIARRLQASEALAAAARERERAVLARQEAEEALRQAQKMEAVGQLTGGVAHDFNNLLTVIGSSVELLRRNQPDAERRLRYVDAIADAAARAAKLTGQLLAFARRQTLQAQVFDAGRNVAAISQMVDRLTGPDIVVETILPDQPCHIDADPNQFDTAVLNLALNSRDAMEGGGLLTIKVEHASGLPPIAGTPERAGRFVAVSVSDNGRGIPPEIRDRIFEPFFTTKKVGQGTGLGLSQVIGFAKQSGGEVSIESTPGKGSTVTLHLPGTEVAGDSPFRPQAAPQDIPDGRGARILVIDDNPEVGQVAVQMLTELNYFSVLLTNAHDALDLLGEDDDYAAVFSDIVMPGMDGIGLARLVRGRHPGLPILLTTGYSAALAEGGADEFPLLFKPYTLAKLGQTLHEAIEGEKASGRPGRAMPESEGAVRLVG